MSQRSKHSPSFLMSFKKKAAVSHIFPWANSQSRPMHTIRSRTWEGLGTTTNFIWHKQETKTTFFWRRYFWTHTVARSRALGNFQARNRKYHGFLWIDGWILDTEINICGSKQLNCILFCLVSALTSSTLVNLYQNVLVINYYQKFYTTQTFITLYH